MAWSHSIACSAGQASWPMGSPQLAGATTPLLPGLVMIPCLSSYLDSRAVGGASQEFGYFLGLPWTQNADCPCFPNRYAISSRTKAVSGEQWSHDTLGDAVRPWSSPLCPTFFLIRCRWLVNSPAAA